MAKLNDKERAKATVNFLLSNHVIDIDEAYDLVASVESQDELDEAEVLIDILRDYQDYLESEVAACGEN